MDIPDVEALRIERNKHYAALFERLENNRWPEKEIEILKSYYPNQIRLAALLPNRPTESWRKQAIRLGLSQKYISWTRSEIVLLKQNYGSASWSELDDLLPRRTRPAIKRRANILRISRNRYVLQLTGIYLIDEIRIRARRLNMNMDDLNSEALRGSLFQHAYSRGNPIFVRFKALDNVISALGGKLEIKWFDE